MPFLRLDTPRRPRIASASQSPLAATQTQPSQIRFRHFIVLGLSSRCVGQLQSCHSRQSHLKNFFLWMTAPTFDCWSIACLSAHGEVPGRGPDTPRDIPCSKSVRPQKTRGLFTTHRIDASICMTRLIGWLLRVCRSP